MSSVRTSRPKTSRPSRLGATLPATTRLPTDRRRDLTRYRSDPVGYVRDILGVRHVWDAQAEIMHALMQPPYRVLVKSGHKVGKTTLAAWMINHRFDCVVPSVAITTAPNIDSVKDSLWAAVRVQRLQARVPLPDHFIGPAAPEMRRGPNHFAKGMTTNRPDAFQGRHFKSMLFVFDEAAGVEPVFWDILKTMLKPGSGHAALAILNPTDPTCRAFIEEQKVALDGKPLWKSFSLSCLEHPNVVAQLRGEPAPIPDAVDLAMVEAWVPDWCDQVQRCEQVGDFEWPPPGARGSDGAALGPTRCWRPTSQWESRCLGRWPSNSEEAVWSDSLWALAAAPLDPRDVVFDLSILPEIGSDTAGAGKDLTEIHSRWGRYSLAHEAHHGWRAPRIQGRLIELCRDLADLATRERRAKLGPGVPAVTPQEIPIKIDDANEGGAIVAFLQEAGYNAVGVIAASQASNPVRYPNKRSELWFTTAKLAAVGAARFGLLPADALAKLRIQSKAPKWKQNSRGQREVEPKDVTKEKLGRSPDGLDALNLAYYDGCAWEAPSAVDVPKPSMEERQQRSERSEETPARRMFGR